MVKEMYDLHHLGNLDDHHHREIIRFITLGDDYDPDSVNGTGRGEKGNRKHYHRGWESWKLSKHFEGNEVEAGNGKHHSQRRIGDGRYLVGE
jgi:hypothetical protein